MCDVFLTALMKNRESHICNDITERLKYVYLITLLYLYEYHEYHILTDIMLYDKIKPYESSDVKRAN